MSELHIESVREVITKVSKEGEAFIDSLDSLRCIVKTHKSVVAYFYGSEAVSEANAEIFVRARRYLSLLLERHQAEAALLDRLVEATEDQDAAPDDVANKCWLIAQDVLALRKEDSQ